NMDIITREIDGREVRMTDSASDICVITFFADFDEGSLNELMQSIPEAKVAALKVGDWNQELSPWEAAPAFGDEGFGDGAEDTLSYIVGSMMPAIGCSRYVIGGYSLAGLFSLWACYQSDRFEGCCAASPSVWFDGWDDFIEGNSFKASKAYLSMGEKESMTRNQRMSKVADRIAEQEGLLSRQIGPGNTVLEWNKGGHFQDVSARKIRSFRWMLEKMDLC
ncbi:MAG: hypothetical protein IKQ67_07445, partial [Candidatus Methanomethylophilaceae archaeon]|nr:hypothetical protein [Candidatus Methanomethylophilaceae archaeon]